MLCNLSDDSLLWVQTKNFKSQVYKSLFYPQVAEIIHLHFCILWYSLNTIYNFILHDTLRRETINWTFFSTGFCFQLLRRIREEDYNSETSLYDLDLVSKLKIKIDCRCTQLGPILSERKEGNRGRGREEGREGNEIDTCLTCCNPQHF